eukprot:GHUV01049806.1.p1 GENE.GHUV01049806.1~~GHUV01049806.1.p1  ORF type:complete len:142 (+),score=33.32 GHUV01049806.1:364-789(+)
MAELTRRATTLIKEMITADGRLPAYNEEVVRQTLQQISSHQDGITQMMTEAARAQNQQRQPQQESLEEQIEEDDAAVDWTNSPEHAGAIVVHHETILKLKRILLTYMKMRQDCLINVRWAQRMLKADVRENMSPQEQQVGR